MIEFQTEPYKDEYTYSILNPLVKDWFKKKFGSFAPAQQFSIINIHQRENTLISSPTGSGKCVTPDTDILVNLNNKVKLVKAADLIELTKKSKKIISVSKSGELWKLKKLKAYSLNKNNIELSDALVYHEDYSGPIYEIETEYGRRVKLSPEHPVLVERSIKKEWTSVKFLKQGERIAVPKSIKLPEKEITLDYKKAIKNLRARFREVVDFRDYTYLKKKTRNFSNFENITTKDYYNLKTILKTTFEKISIKTGLGITTIYNIFNKNTQYKKERIFEVFKHIKNVVFEKNRIIVQNNANFTVSFLYPKKISANLAKWMSFVLVEGHIGDCEKGTHLLVSQKKRIKLLEEFFKITKEIFDLEFKKKNDIDYVICSTAFCYFVTDLLNVSRGIGRHIEIPDWILNANKDVKTAFLYTFFSLEGEVTEKEIRLTQGNERKIEIINYLLLSLGIFASISRTVKFATNTKNKIKREYYCLTVRGIKNVTIFLNQINIDHQNKTKLSKCIYGVPSGKSIYKHYFDYKKISSLSKYYKNYDDFENKLGSIYEVVRRTGHISEDALINLKRKISRFRFYPYVEHLLNEIDEKLNANIVWLKIRKIRKINYSGKLVDLSVPKFQNFIGGNGAIYLHNTLSSFLAILNELIDLSEKDLLEDKVYCIYISPLKALANDIERNLNEPLNDIKETAEKLGKKINVRVGIRTGDTTATEKSKMLKKPPHILITTPESFAIVLTTKKFRDKIKDVQWVIVDEIHAVASSKRGVHLSLSLERLNATTEFTRIGLSATVSPLEEVAKFLVGLKNPDTKEYRDCKIVDVQFLKKLDLKVLSPVENLIDTSHETTHSEMYKLMNKLIQEHKTTLIFTNTRSATERVVHYLKDKFPGNYLKLTETDEGNLEANLPSYIGAHHGSLSRELRLDVEQRLKEGKLKCVVTSTSLELGIDIGYIDLVILLSSPKSVARALQRIGRSGHKLHDEAKGRIIVLDRDDLVECSVLLKAAIEKKIDKIDIPQNCLDVLAQQIFGMCLEEQKNVNEVFDLVRKSYNYRELDRKDFKEIIDYLRGEYVSLEDRNVYAKIWFDEETGMMGCRGRLARVIYMTNVGTIPDETAVKVKLRGQGGQGQEQDKEKYIGKIDENFLERLKRGDIFVLGGNVYEFLYAQGMTVFVKASGNRPPTVPSWFSEQLPLSFDLAMEIQKFRRYMEEYFESKASKEDILKFINSYLYVDSYGANSIYEYFKEQYKYAEIPHDKKIIIEHYTEGDKKYIIFHSLFGRRVNDVLSRAIGFVISKTYGQDVEINISDNGFYILTDKKVQVLRAFETLHSANLRELMKVALYKTEILGRRFRHCAARALMILRSYMGRKKTVSRQQMSSRLLISAVRKISEDFPILKEARREVLEDLMDIKNAELVLKDIENRKIQVKEIFTEIPTPFAFNLISMGYLDIMKMEEKVEFLKRMHDMILAKISLKEGKGE